MCQTVKRNVFNMFTMYRCHCAYRRHTRLSMAVCPFFILLLCHVDIICYMTFFVFIHIPYFCFCFINYATESLIFYKFLKSVRWLQSLDPGNGSNMFINCIAECPARTNICSSFYCIFAFCLIFFFVLNFLLFMKIIQITTVTISIYLNRKTVCPFIDICNAFLNT